MIMICIYIVNQWSPNFCYSVLQLMFISFVISDARSLAIAFIQSKWILELTKMHQQKRQNFQKERETSFDWCRWGGGENRTRLHSLSNHVGMLLSHHSITSLIGMFPEPRLISIREKWIEYLSQSKYSKSKNFTWMAQSLILV